ncbi:MAG: tyrosine-protein phosphatase [Actinomycetes bacterium]
MRAPIWLDLDGAVNARDLGGLPTVDGRTTRPGVLLRADNLQDLSARDVDRLVGELGVRTVVDLRSTGEVHLAGPTPLAGSAVRHVQLSLIPEWDGEPDVDEVERAVEQAVVNEHDEPQALDAATTEKALPSLSDFEERARQRRDPTDLADHYIGYVEAARTNLGTALKVLADPQSGTTLVHCAAGKDRTGVVVALALSLVGVPRDAVLADYLRSAERADRILARLQSTDVYGPSLAGVSVDDITPRAASMEGFLDHVDTAYGGPHGMALALGVTEEEIARLGVRLLGTSPSVR